MSDAASILQHAAELIDGDRNDQHGDRFECHTLIARLWTVYLGVKIGPAEVATCFELAKIARSKTGQHNIDNYVDRAGYAALAGEIANVKNTTSMG